MDPKWIKPENNHNTWELINNTRLKNACTKEEETKEMKIQHQNLRDAVKVALQGKFVVINT